jgi:hypothetical protein
MAKRHYYDWRQFYICYENGSEELFDKPKFLSQPNRTKIWQHLRTQFQRNSEIKSIGWRTVKPLNS